MAIIRGTVRGRDGALEGVSVEVKNESFETIYSAVTGSDGGFSLSVPDGTYPFLTAVRDYADKYLEYWAQNIPAWGQIDIRADIDTLEVYGLHAFHVKGAANALTVFFRPMSLKRFKSGCADIAPELGIDDVAVTVDGRRSRIYSIDRVREYGGEENVFLTAYMLQISVPDSADTWRRVDVTVRDSDGAFGCATVFR